MQDEKMKQEKIIFQNSKGQKLVGVLYSSEYNKESPIVVFCHGYRSTKDTSKVKPLAENLTLNEISLFAFDFSGRGESEGKFEDTTITQYIDDLKCAIDKISKFTEGIGVIGSSLGGLVSLQETIQDKRVKALVLLSPVSHFPWRISKEFSQKGLKEWKEKGYAFTFSEKFGKLKINYSFYEDGAKYGDYSVYKNINIPVLVFHGTVDESVSIEDSKRLIKYLKNPKLITLEGADHRYTTPNDFNKVIGETSKFIIEVLK